MAILILESDNIKSLKAIAVLAKELGMKVTWGKEEKNIKPPKK